MTVIVKCDQKTGLHYLVDDDTGPVEEVNAFLVALSTRGLSPRTIRAYAFDLVTVYRWFEYAKKDLKKLTHSDLLEFISHEKERSAHPSSINRRLTVCRMLFEFWYPDGIETNSKHSFPASFYKGPGRDRRLGVHLLKKKRSLRLQVKVPKKLVVPLTGAQVRGFLSNLRRYRDIAIVHLMLLCGLRSREVLLLRRSDVSLSERRVRISGKGNRERFVPLGGLVAISIDQYLQLERPHRCVNDALFVCLQGKRKGRAMTPSGLRSLFRTQRKKKTLGDANPHRFRHTFGTDMARSGMRLPVLQKLMGHENPETTLQYINLSMADVAEAYRTAAAQIQKNYDME